MGRWPCERKKTDELGKQCLAGRGPCSWARDVNKGLVCLGVVCFLKAMLVWRMAGHGHAEMAGGCMAHTREGHQGREALLGHAEVAGGLAKERRQNAEGVVACAASWEGEAGARVNGRQGMRLCAS